MNKFDLNVSYVDSASNDFIDDDRVPQFQIDIYDDDGEWYAQTVGPLFPDCLKHALHLANPVLAASTFPDHFNWAEEHRIDYGNDNQ